MKLYTMCIAVFFILLCTSIMPTIIYSQFTGNPALDIVILDELLSDDDEEESPTIIKYGRHDVPDIYEMQGYPGIGTGTISY